MSPDDPCGNAQRRRLTLAEQAVLVIAAAGAVAPDIARRASERGARVALTARKAPNESLVNGAIGVTSELGSEGDVDRLYDTVLEHLTRLDVVVMVFEAQASLALHELSLEAWRRDIAEPLRQAFWVARRAMDEFVGSGHGGRLIFVVDRPDGATSGDGGSILSEALASLTRSLAREYGRCAVSCQVVVQAGPVEHASCGPDARHAVVECVLFLASPAASFVTGEMVMVGSPVTPSVDGVRLP